MDKPSGENYSLTDPPGAMDMPLLPIKITRDKVQIDGKDIGMVHKLSYSDGPGVAPGNLTLDVYALTREIEIELESRVTINKIDTPPDIIESISLYALLIRKDLQKGEMDRAAMRSEELVRLLVSYGWIKEDTATSLGYSAVYPSFDGESK